MDELRLTGSLEDKFIAVVGTGEVEQKLSWLEA